MLVLTSADLRRAVSMPEAMDAVANAFAEFSAGQTMTPPRMSLPLSASDSLALLMPARLARSGAFGVKVLSIVPDNPSLRGLPAIAALVLIFDIVDGQPLALLDGGPLTALRTGAASGVATRLLARQDARTLALFGAGAQALPQALAACAARPIQRILLVNRTTAHAERLAGELRGYGPPVPPAIEIAASARDALAEADVVCTATAAPTPLFADTDLRPGTHVNAIGAFQPDHREVPGETVGRARLVVDSRDSAWSGAGDLILARDEGHLAASAAVAELGELVLGQAPGRASADEITLFKSVGLAVQDVAVAQFAYTRARALGLGAEIAL